MVWLVQASTLHLPYLVVLAQMAAEMLATAVQHLPLLRLADLAVAGLLYRAALAQRAALVIRALQAAAQVAVKQLLPHTTREVTPEKLALPC